MVAITRVESFVALLGESTPMVRRHYEAMSLHREAGFALAPDMEKYLILEAGGKLVTLVLRDGSKAIGYWSMVIDTALHYRQVITSTMDLFWIEPEHRNAGNILALMRAAERECRSRGVRAWFGGEKLSIGKPLAPLYASLGFEPFERTWLKWLGEWRG